jgi:hypothetical protein
VNEFDLKQLDELSRDELIARATGLGVARAELLTRVELRDEIVRLTATDAQERQRARGWFGVARDLVASVVEQRLNLPDAADLIRGVNVRLPRNVAPVATVTLAEIYAAQGHVNRAVKMLDEVLAREPDHVAARDLRERLNEQAKPQGEPEVQATAEEPEEFEEAETAEVGSMPPESATSETLGPDDAVAQEQNPSEPVTQRRPDFDAAHDYLIYRRVESSVMCHWSIRSKRWNEASAQGSGQWILRIVRISPVAGVMAPAQTDVVLPGTTGEVMLDDVATLQQVRMAIGWEGNGRFIPAAIGVEVAGSSHDNVELAWLPIPGFDEPTPAAWLDCARRCWPNLEMGQRE